MYQYPNYSAQMNNYGQYYSPQQTYLDRLNAMQAQQYQQNIQMQPTQMSGANQQMPAGINGKVVLSVENITANDVPMDGSVAFFPKQDMSEIYAKSWNADGTIKTVIYKPFVNETNNLPQNGGKALLGLSDEVTGAFMKRFDDIADRIERLEQSMTKPMTKASVSRAKKEADADE